METETEARESAASVPHTEGPLADIFPGKTITLDDGRILTVKKWTAKQVVREVPAILGDVLVKLANLAQVGLSDANVIASTLIIDAAEQVMDLIAMTVGVEKKTLEDIGADELVRLVRKVVEVNWSFFDEIQRLYDMARTRLGSRGTASPSA